MLLLYIIIYYYILLYTIIYYYILLYVIIHHYILLYIIICYYIFLLQYYYYICIKSPLNSHSTSIIAIVYACNMCWSIPSWFCNSRAFCTHFLMARTCQTLLFVVQNGHGRYGSKPWCNVVVFFFSIVNSTCAPYIPLFHCRKPGSKDSEVNHNPTIYIYTYP